MSWNLEKEEKLKKLWGKGSTASEIAQIIGGVTRNAVIGKAHRLGLEGRPSPIRGGGSSRSKRNRAISRALEARALRGTMADEEIGGEPVMPPHGQKNMERPLAPPARPVSDVKECLWPIGDPSDPGFSFCGAETSPGRPYCAAHCAMAYIRKDRTAA